MEIAFRVRNVEVPENLRRVTLDKVVRLAGLCGIDRAEVFFSEERNPRIAKREVCEITLFGRGRILRAQAAATEVSVAAGRVVGKLEQRADRFQGRQSGRRGGARLPLGAWTTAASGGSVHFPTNWSTAAGEPVAVDHGTCDAGEAAYVGIRDSKAEPMTPEEAALEMGEQGNDIYVFVNAETGRRAVVCRRDDGHIALYDAAGSAPRSMV